jgi:hypothetical protein
MEALCFSEMTVNSRWNTRRYIQEDKCKLREILGHEEESPGSE